MPYNNTIRISCYWFEVLQIERSNAVSTLSLGILNVFFGLMALLSNLCFVITFILAKSMRKVEIILIFSLSVSDLGCGIFVQLTLGGRLLSVFSGHYNHYCWMKSAEYFASLIFVIVTLFTLTLISIERYLAVFKEQFYLTYVTKRLMTFIAISAWIVVIIWIVVSGLMRNYKIFLQGNAILAVFLILWNIFAYARIFWKLKIINRRVLALEQRLQGQELSVKQARKSYKCLAIALTFIGFYIPAICLLHIALNGNMDLIMFYQNLSLTIGSISGSINPCLYFATSSSIRNEIIRTILFWKNTTK